VSATQVFGLALLLFGLAMIGLAMILAGRRR
jgi:hypothetical protein